jgi:hypothetical protein
MDEDEPLFEKIHTMTDERRETRKRVAAKQRKSACYKTAFSRKQALTQKNSLLTRGVAAVLFTYKCKDCGWWHLTHKSPRL